MAHTSDIQEDSGAIFDTTGTYRYTLWRRWSLDYPQVAFMMLNPSTADSQRNDATIRRCINFARLWGFGALEVVNLFAYKATSPRELLNVENPVGSENDRYLLRALERSACLVVAWGTHGTLLGRDREVLKLLTCYPTTTLKCLGLTKEGHPRHPLYLGSRTQLMTFPFVGRGQAASAPTIETGLESRRGRFIVPSRRPDKSGVGTINRPLHWFDVFVGVNGTSHRPYEILRKDAEQHIIAARTKRRDSSPTAAPNCVCPEGCVGKQ